MFRKIGLLVLALMLSMSLMLTGCAKGEASETDVNEPSTEVNDDGNEATSESASEEAIDTEPAMGGDMVIRATSDPRVVHPLYGNDRITLTLIKDLFDPLFVVENGEVAEYKLAESVEISEDYLTYTVKLKDNLKWHDGESITADDLVFSCETMSDENQASHLSENFILPSGNVAVEKVDELTVQFVLPEIQVAYLDVISGLRIFPEHIYGGIENIQSSDVNLTPVGSGPFKWGQLNSGESIILERFDDYYNEKAYLDRIIYKIVPDANAAVIAFQNGELDCMYVYPEDVERLENANIVAFDEDRVGYIIMNQNNDALKNKELRQAISYALDREELLLAQYLSEDYAEMATSFLAKDALYRTTELEAYERDIEKAKALVESSGLQGTKLTMAYIGNDDIKEVLVQSYLKEIGIEVELKAMEIGAFYNALFDAEHNHEYDLAFNGYIYGKEPSSYDTIFKTGSMNNVNNYSNSEVDALFEAGAKETDSVKRQAIYEEIQRIIADDAVMYPVSYGFAVVAANPKLKGLEEAKPASIHMFDDLSKVWIAE